MEIWIAAVCAALVLCAAILVILDNRQQQQRQNRVRNMRKSPLYTIIKTDLEKVKGRPVDEILIERDRLVIVGVYPPEKIVDIPLSPYRRRMLRGTFTDTLRDLLADELHELNDPTRYRLHRYHTHYPNNERCRSWEYTARPAYKAYILRTRSWYAAEAHRDE